MRIGIDLLWVRPGICGGTESYTRNLLNGFAQYATEHEYILFVTEDNEESFCEYQEFNNMALAVCPTKYVSQVKRILWENMHLAGVAKKQKVDLMLIPVYSKPFSWGSKIPYVTVIHDLQGLHYPEYFSYGRLQFFKWCWWYGCRTSKRVIVDSDYGKEDLIKYYPFVKKKVIRVYAPISSTEYHFDVHRLLDKYDVVSGEYFYCVSALLPHKNLETVLRVMQSWSGKEKLVLSGVGNQKEELAQLIEEYRLWEKLVLTGFVSDEERDCLYDNCKLFLFPSVFEGFGMPPIEAMRKGKRVVMTEKTCLKEVTQGKAVYVQEAGNVEEWEEKIRYAMTLPEKTVEFKEYDLETIVKEYCKVFREAL